MSNEALYGRHLYVNIGIAFASFVGGKYEGQLSTDDFGNEYRWVNGLWRKIRDAGTELTAEVGIPSQKHDRYRTGISATWPSNDNFSVTFTQAENVRRYRLYVTGGADGDFVKWTEDAVNEAQAEAWLANPASSGTLDVENRKIYTSTPDANGSFIPIYSDWIELSKDTNDDSLSRLDFLASAAGPFVVHVEAE